jgi:hypothetical protein
MKTTLLRAFAAIVAVYFFFAMYGQIRVEADYFKAFGSFLFVLTAVLYFVDLGRKPK